MHSGISSTHLAQPLTTDETAELARLEQKVKISNQLTRLDSYLTRFYHRHYPRWLALNPILPNCYYGAWSIPVARWPWSARPYLIWRPSLCLTISEEGLLEYLGARQRRPAELARHDHNPADVNGWIADYERKKASEPKPHLQLLWAVEALKEFKVKLREKKAYLQRFKEEDLPVYLRHLEGLKKNAKAFKQHVKKDLPQTEQAKTNKGKAPAQPARLATGISSGEVREILHGFGMGTEYHKSGEWAVALRALFVERVLVGSSPAEITLWAIGQNYITAKNGSSVRDTWRDGGYRRPARLKKQTTEGYLLR